MSLTTHKKKEVDKIILFEKEGVFDASYVGTTANERTSHKSMGRVFMCLVKIDAVRYFAAKAFMRRY